MKILTICPSIYPSKLKKMLDSFTITRSKSTTLIVNSDKYKTITEIFNKEFESNPDYDFYFMANDDIIFNTPLWDLKLAKKGKITHGTDAVDIGINGQFLMIDGDIVRSVGWLQLPTLNKYAGDVVWRFIGENLGILEHIPEVIIKHNWEGADEKINKEDMLEFSKWLPWSFKDISNIRKALNGIS